jgi:hypothetical protein
MAHPHPIFVRSFQMKEPTKTTSGISFKSVHRSVFERDTPSTVVGGADKNFNRQPISGVSCDDVLAFTCCEANPSTILAKDSAKPQTLQPWAVNQSESRHYHLLKDIAHIAWVASVQSNQKAYFHALLFYKVDTCRSSRVLLWPTKSYLICPKNMH